MMTDTQFDGTYAALITADDVGDAEGLAQIAWQLFGELGLIRDHAAGHQLLLARLAAAARLAVTASAAGAPDPTLQLRHVLAGGCWLAEPGGGIPHHEGDAAPQAASVLAAAP